MRAAEYVRMSTDHQRYSIDNQRLAIAEYAGRHGYEVIQTYADPGKSGLSLKGRSGLRQLLADAISPNREFSAILVYDVSRWGRFSDPDEAAHYEFLCRQAGLKVAYCAEAFDNDSSPMTAILKQLKRVMAHEYSRDLSERCYRSHTYQASLGFRQGGGQPYGFRRQVINEAGDPRFMLSHGQEKALRTDRVIAALGSSAEQAVIRAIYQLYMVEEYSMTAIARHLRAAGIPGNEGRPWSLRMVKTVLTSELCVGRYVYNRTTKRLQSRRLDNPEHLWVRGPAHVAPLVSDDTFQAAQNRIRSRRRHLFDNDRMLDQLRALWREKGMLSITVIAHARGVPHPATYQDHFGSLRAAFRLIDYVPPLCRTGSQVWTMEEFRAGLAKIYERHGYISHYLIDKDPSLPSSQTLKRRIGPPSELYKLIDVVPQTHSTKVRLGTERRVAEGAQRKGRPYAWKTEQIISVLRELLAERGYLSMPMIAADPRLPSTRTIADRFGSILKAYEAVGWQRHAARLTRLRNKTPSGST